MVSNRDAHCHCSGFLAMHLKRQKVKHFRLFAKFENLICAKILKSDLHKKFHKFTLDTHHAYFKVEIVLVVSKLSSLVCTNLQNVAPGGS